MESSNEEMGSLGRGRRALLRNLDSRKRSREGRVLVEGGRTIREALAAGLPIDFGVVDTHYLHRPEGSELSNRLAARGVEVLEAGDVEYREVAATEEPQGALIVCVEPTPALADLAPRAEAGILVLDGVQDPGNVGTLVRSAWALGAGGVIALQGTADPWRPKAVRASAGGCFHLPLVRSSEEAFLAWVKEVGLQLLVASADGDSPDSEQVRGGWALVVGNEAAGVRGAVVESAERRVGVPMPGGAESLNAAVAGSILLYAIRRGGGR